MKQLANVFFLLQTDFEAHILFVTKKIIVTTVTIVATVTTATTVTTVTWKVGFSRAAQGS